MRSIAYMKSEPRIARHLHIPIQAADDEVLRAMNRPYDTAWFAQRMRFIRSQLPGISISTDMIAGFPGESEAQFTRALTLVEEELRFSFIHCFSIFTPASHTTRRLPCPTICPMRCEKGEGSPPGRLVCALAPRLYGKLHRKEADVIIEQKKEGMLFGLQQRIYPGIYPMASG